VDQSKHDYGQNILEAKLGHDIEPPSPIHPPSALPLQSAMYAMLVAKPIFPNLTKQSDQAKPIRQRRPRPVCQDASTSSLGLPRFLVLDILPSSLIPPPQFLFSRSWCRDQRSQPTSARHTVVAPPLVSCLHRCRPPPWCPVAQRPVG
jgi:hypothetical protein